MYLDRLAILQGVMRRWAQKIPFETYLRCLELAPFLDYRSALRMRPRFRLRPLPKYPHLEVGLGDEGVGVALYFRRHRDERLTLEGGLSRSPHFHPV